MNEVNSEHIGEQDSRQAWKVGQVWKVGQLATATGLTVRTLHHYDHVGLLRPSQRTESGHRLYTEPDVQRLYQVLALRQLGLSLDAAAAVLSGSTDIADVLAAHEQHVQQQQTALRRLQAHLGTLRTARRESPQTSVDSFLNLIREVVVMDDTVHHYFSERQLAQLAERREQVGEQAIADVEAAWGDLIPRVDAALQAGMDPSSAEAQDMAREWMGLLEQFHGGDTGLRDSLYRMQAENAEQIEQEHSGPTPAQIDFIRQANAARQPER